MTHDMHLFMILDKCTPNSYPTKHCNLPAQSINPDVPEMIISNRTQTILMPHYYT